MRKSAPLALLLILSLFAPLMGAGGTKQLAPTPLAQTWQSASARRSGKNKMPESLRALASRSRAANSSDKTRVILNLADAKAASAARVALQRAGADVQGQLDALGLLIAEVPTAQLEELAARDEIAWMSADQEVRSLSVDNTSHIEITTGASKVLPQGNTAMANGGGGNKVGIAILDSGISPSDAAEFNGYQWQSSGGVLGLGLLLSQSYVQSYDRIKKHIDFTGENSTADAYGHGTHTAGVAAGTGQSSETAANQNPNAQTFGGIATGANLVDVRVLNSQGSGTISNVIAGINWVIQNRNTYNIRVMNLSLGTPVTQSYRTDPLCQAVSRAADAGITVVVAAGNWGKDSNGNTIYGGILSPANSPDVITVGATNTQQTNVRSDDVVTSYSSRGPTLVDGIAKPDLVAPGNRIGAAETASSSPNATYSYSTTGGGGVVGTLLFGNTTAYNPQATGTYQVLSGTSFAAPAVSGTVALMIEANPSLTPSIVKALLMRTAQRLPVYEAQLASGEMTTFERVITEGAGALNTYAAVTLAKAVRKDANQARIGDNLITQSNTTYQTLNLTSPIAGEAMPLNNGLVWVEGVAFTDRLRLTQGYRLPDGNVITSGFALADGYMMNDGSYVFSDGLVVSSGIIIMSSG
ncbi:MAG: S8 family peptidase, partial [Acidobacteria bacterium]|nr:S8 family peptidase [Acidobacteriota bacterium]